MQLTDGVYKIDGVRGANSYLVGIEEGLVVVDTGIPGNAKRILELVSGLGRKPSDVRCIVLTHADIDHAGSAAVLKELTGAQLAVHELDAPVVAGETRPQKGGWVMASLFKLLGFRPAEVDILLRDGDEIGGLRVLHTPGHTRGSITLRREDGVVFCGDALLADKHGNVRPPDERLSADPAEAMETAERIREQGWTLLLTGHGAPVREPEPGGGR
jgi:glyoxylase-like metal-dependent hydrolase (beta-lactamase superfamily II)